MRSNASSDLLDLDRDLPTTAEDVAALRRHRHLPRITLEDYLRFLEAFTPPSLAALRSRKGPSRGQPFQLVAS